MSECLQGLGVSPGAAVGRAWVVTGEELPAVPSPIGPERVDDEIARFRRAREAARQEIELLRERVHRSLGESYAGILSAQMLMLDDPSLVERTVERIRVGRVGARWALKETMAEVAARFDAIDDEYMRERATDLLDVHRRLQRLLRGAGRTDGAMPDGPLIVVAHDLTPSHAAELAGRGVIGLASDVGGRTSHTAILAQALSVPAVAGLHDVTRRIRSGEPIVIDGNTGEVWIRADEAAVREGEARRRRWEARSAAAIDAAVQYPAITADGTPIVLRANLEFAAEADAAVRFGAQGVGLYRSEFLFLSRSPDLPSEDEHFRTYVEIAERVAPHPAVIRTLDLGGEKYFHEVLDSHESNPVLGLRAVRLCLRRPDIFRPQLRGLLRAAARCDIRVMLPLVTSPDEIWAVRNALAEEAAALRADGVPIREDLQLGIMIEVPAAAAAADILACESDFFSIGTNDLIQYALAADRGSESASYLYQPRHPGVLRMIRFVIEAADTRGIPVSLCGEMGADPEMVPLLLGLGLRELSVQPRAMGAVREAIRATHLDLARREAQESLHSVRPAEHSRRIAGER